MKMTLVLFAFLYANAEEKKDLMKDIKNIQAIQKQSVKKTDGTSIDLEPYKNVKLKEQKADVSLNCTSLGGVEYKPGTVGYDSCMREQDTYIPTGFETKKK
ncbi:MAG: hypothetical protein IT287_05075 [Bdellovibrionaceae bacterium]|nr:hypothetical protein [Pseudobdellovibrionaceae bacterium]